MYGEWQMGNSKWGTANGADQLDGRWETANLEWQMRNSKCRTANRAAGNMGNGKCANSK